MSRYGHLPQAPGTGQGGVQSEGRLWAEQGPSHVHVLWEEKGSQPSMSPDPQVSNRLESPAKRAFLCNCHSVHCDSVLCVFLLLKLELLKAVH